MSGFRAVQAPSRADNKRGDKEGALYDPYLNMLRFDIDDVACILLNTIALLEALLLENLI